MPPSDDERPTPPLPTTLDQVSQSWLATQLERIENYFDKKADALAIIGSLFYGVDYNARLALEQLDGNRSELLVILHTDGGLVEVVQRMVNVMRKRYSTVRFLVPDRAMSAGTVLTMSGDAIFDG